MERYRSTTEEPLMSEMLADPVLRHLRHFDGLDLDRWSELMLDEELPRAA